MIAITYPYQSTGIVTLKIRLMYVRKCPLLTKNILSIGVYSVSLTLNLNEVQVTIKAKKFKRLASPTAIANAPKKREPSAPVPHSIQKGSLHIHDNRVTKLRTFQQLSNFHAFNDQICGFEPLQMTQYFLAQSAIIRCNLTILILI